jgi:acyl dehydratase
VELGSSSWVQITQDQVNPCADATWDHQWIHVDPQRANAGPFSGTIVHSYLTLALAPVFMAEVLKIQNYVAVLNYDVNRVRFRPAAPGMAPLEPTPGSYLPDH